MKFVIPIVFLLMTTSLLGQCGPPLYSCISTSIANPGTVSPYFSTVNHVNDIAYDTSINPVGTGCITLVADGTTFSTGLSMAGTINAGDNDIMSSVNETYIAATNVGGGNAILHLNTSGTCMQVINTGAAGINDTNFRGFSKVVDTRYYSVVSKTQLWQNDITSDSTKTSTMLVDLSAAGVCPGVNWGTFGTPTSIGIVGISQNDDTFGWAISPGNQNFADWSFVWSRTKGCSTINFATGQVWAFCASGCSSATPALGTLGTTHGECWGSKGSVGGGIHDQQMNGAGTFVRVSITDGAGWTQGACVGDLVGAQDSIWQIGTLNDTWSYNEVDKGVGAYEFNSHPSDGVNNVLGQFFADIGYNIRPYSALRSPVSFYPHITAPLNDFHCSWAHPLNDDTYPWVCAGDEQLDSTNSGCTFHAQCPTWPQNMVYSVNPTLGLGQLAHTFFHTESGNPVGASFAHGPSGVGDAYFGPANAIGFVTAKGNFFCWSSTVFQNMGLDPNSNPRSVLLCGRLGAVLGTPLSFFGVHYNKSTSLYPPNPTLSFKNIRFWDTATGWADMQVGPNCTHTVTTDCRFSHFDTLVNKFVNPTPKIILTLAKTPNFIASNTTDVNCGYTSSLGNPNGSCTPPRDINCDGTGTDATFINFVTALWDHINSSGFVGRINFLEIWNEWNVPTFYDITYINSTLCPGVTNAAEKILTRLEQDARCVLHTAGTTTCNAGGTYPVKGEENAVQIMSSPLPGPGNNNAQIKTGGVYDKYLSVGGGTYADYISIHGYLDNKGQTQANCGAAPGNVGCMWPENLVSMINQLNTLQSTYGLNLPLIISEGSWGAQSNANDPQFQQAFVGRYYTLMLQYGIQMFPWYNIDGGSTTLPVLYANNTTGILTTGGTAVQTIESWLVNKAFTTNHCTVTAQAGCSGGASSNTYECNLTSGERVVWYDEVADNASCSYSNTTGFGTYLTMSNTVVPIVGPITLDNRPILLEPLAPTTPTGLKITVGVKLTGGSPGILLHP